MSTPDTSSTSLVLNRRLLAALLSLTLASCGGEEWDEGMGGESLEPARSGGALTQSITVLSPNGGESLRSNSFGTARWSASGVTAVKVELTVDGSTWRTVVASADAASGSYSWGVPVIATNVAKVRVSDASNSAISDTSNAAFTLTTSGGGGTFDGVLINEVLVNEAGTDVTREFVEVVNPKTTAQDISGWTLWDAAGPRHTFPSGTSLGAGRGVVVFGAASGIPAGLTNAVAASTGSLNLSNGSETVTLKGPTGNVIDSVYLDSALSATDGVSATRSPDGTSHASFVVHTSVASTLASPGKRANGTSY
ncbi:MAG TPA: lamin tail domain-containing protein [Archangium sp.]|jgi:hypothetical protein|uniref:lamin tail domain-containing protein n=1 Tax=Archangium sp. TaxID=1872627 RepID=UPI002EDA5CE0